MTDKEEWKGGTSEEQTHFSGSRNENKNKRRQSEGERDFEQITPYSSMSSVNECEERNGKAAGGLKSIACVLPGHIAVGRVVKVTEELQGLWAVS